MAIFIKKNTTMIAALAFSFLIFFTLPGANAGGEDPPSSHFPVHGREKYTHIHFYFHDIITAPPQPTAIPVAQGPNTNKSTMGFGILLIADDPLTEGPELTSTRVGQAQGMYASASQEELAFAMIFNFAFTSGKYNGSTLSLLGRNAIFNNVREMPIVGGSGLFRWARGYAEARTYSIDLKTNNAVVEYNIYVMHY